MEMPARTSVSCRKLPGSTVQGLDPMKPFLLRGRCAMVCSSSKVAVSSSITALRRGFCTTPSTTAAAALPAAGCCLASSVAAPDIFLRSDSSLRMVSACCSSVMQLAMSAEDMEKLAASEATFSRLCPSSKITTASCQASFSDCRMELSSR